MWHSFTLKILTLLVSFTCSHRKTIGGAEAEAPTRGGGGGGADARRRTRRGGRAEADGRRAPSRRSRLLPPTRSCFFRGALSFVIVAVFYLTFFVCTTGDRGAGVRGVRGVGGEGRGGERRGGACRAPSLSERGMEDEGGKRSTPQDRQGGVAAIAETGVWGGMRRRGGCAGARHRTSLHPSDARSLFSAVHRRSRSGGREGARFLSRSDSGRDQMMVAIRLRSRLEYGLD